MDDAAMMLSEVDDAIAETYAKMLQAESSRLAAALRWHLANLQRYRAHLETRND